MPTSRTDLARKVVLSILIADALLILVAFTVIGSWYSPSGFSLASILWGLACAAPFVIAAAQVRSAPGVERSLLAQALAWTVGFLVPLTAAFFLNLGSGHPEDYILIVFCGVQMVIPAITRWARKGSQFVPVYGGMLALLGAVFFYVYHRM